MKLITEAQQREAVVQGRSLSPYWLRYNINENEYRKQTITIELQTT
ncbi:MAG: hypothetical protein LBJ00_03040 [Planctomycetaceae bacterium]|nr:hypothetical protein [Planctomycetaceae bacterium]